MVRPTAGHRPGGAGSALILFHWTLRLARQHIEAITITVTVTANTVAVRLG